MQTQKRSGSPDGTNMTTAKYAIIMIHGRGATATGIRTLAPLLNLKETSIFAPQAPGGSWYPKSFMAPVQENQPDLDRSLALLANTVKDVHNAGFGNHQILFLGFSQGACLALEYVTRNASRYAGIIAFTGGLIGADLDLDNYSGDFLQTPVLITTSNPDHHVPLKRVKETGKLIEGMNADITVVAYPGKAHNISDEELHLANTVVLDKLDFT
jgi:phospholipase/carboxylesterase